MRRVAEAGKLVIRSHFEETDDIFRAITEWISGARFGASKNKRAEFILYRVLCKLSISTLADLRLEFAFEHLSKTWGRPVSDSPGYSIGDTRSHRRSK